MTISPPSPVFKLLWIGICVAFVLHSKHCGRLEVFIDQNTKPATVEKQFIHTKVSNEVYFDTVTLYTPNYEQLLWRDISFVLPEHQSLLVVGPSGCGKSSLFRAIARYNIYFCLHLTDRGIGYGNLGVALSLLLQQRTHLYCRNTLMPHSAHSNICLCIHISNKVFKYSGQSNKANIFV